MRKRKKLMDFLLETILWVLSLIILIPLLMVLLNSVKNVTESAVMSLKLPSSIHFENFLTVLKRGNMYRAFFNSLLISGTTAFITLISSAMAAFALNRNRTKVNRYIYMIFLLGLVAPINYISTMRVMQLLHIINTYVGAILLYTAINIPFTIFLYYGFISGIPKELEEAAIIDGCSGFGVFFKIIFPLLKPVTVTALIITFLNCWNDFVIPLYFLNSSKKWGMIMTMYNYFSQFVSSWNLVCAAMIFNLIPIIIVYVSGQKYIVSGMTAGSVKG